MKNINYLIVEIFNNGCGAIHSATGHRECSRCQAESILAWARKSGKKIIHSAVAENGDTTYWLD